MAHPRRMALLALTLATVLGSAALAQQEEATNVTGEWSLSMQGPQGMVHMEIELAQDQEGAITGTLNGPMGTAEVTGLTEGNEIMFYIMVESPDGDYGLLFTGAVEENKKIVGKMENEGGEISVDFTAERKEG